MKRRVVIPVVVAMASLLPGAALSAKQTLLSKQIAAVQSATKNKVATAAVSKNLATMSTTSWYQSDIYRGCNKLGDTCRYGTGNMWVAIYGDSHAPIWAFALVPALRKMGYRVVMYWRSGCTPAHLDVNATMCTSAWRQSVEDAITKGPKKASAVIVVERTSDVTLKNGATVSASMWRDSLAETLSFFKRSGVTTVLWGDNPVALFGTTYNPTYMPSSCVSLHLTNLRTCDTSLSAALAINLIAAEKAAATTTGVGYVDTTAWFCSRSTMTCPPVIDSMVVNYDTFHVSWLYAAKLTPLASEMLTPLLK